MWFWKRPNLRALLMKGPLAFLPVQAQSVGCEEKILRDIATCDVHQDVTCHHLHKGGSPSNPAGAGEACPLHGAGATHRLMDRKGEGGRRRHRL